MRRKLTLVIIILCISVTFGCNKTSNTIIDTKNVPIKTQLQLQKTFTSDKLNITFQYPSEWQLEDSTLINTDCINPQPTGVKGNIVNIRLDIPGQGGFFIEGASNKECAYTPIINYFYATDPSEIHNYYNFNYQEIFEVENNRFYLTFAPVTPGTNAFHAFMFGYFQAVPSLHFSYNPETLANEKEYVGNEPEYLMEKENFLKVLSSITIPKVEEEELTALQKQNWFNKAITYDKSNVYFLENLVPNADPKTFKLIPDKIDLYQDKNAIYLLKSIKGGDHRIIRFEGAKLSSFELIYYQGRYAKDTNNLYYEGNIIEDADSSTFQEVSWPYFRDKNHIYKDGQIIKSFDVETFNFISQDGYEAKYFKDKNHVYYYNGEEAIIVDDADPITFKQLASNDYHYKDKSNIYHFGKKVQLIAPDINSIDLETFDIFPSTAFAKDKNHVYYNYLQFDYYAIVNQMDVATFHEIDWPYSKDKNHVYFYEQIIEQADVDTFEVSQQHGFAYKKDKNHLYYGGKALKEIDANSFEVLSNFYAKDKNHVYYQNIDDFMPIKRVKKADPSTFTILNYNYRECAKDSKNFYCNGKIVRSKDPIIKDLQSAVPITIRN